MLNLLVLIFTLNAQAAIPLSTKNILKMKDDKRMQVARSQDPKFYNRLMVVAFNKNEELEDRWKALTLGFNLRQQDALPEIEKALASPEWFMKNAALMSLKEINKEQANTAALRLLSDSALVVRSAAVDAITKDNEISVRETLWRELNKDYNFQKKESLWVRAEIVEKLATNPIRSEYQKFARALFDRDDRLYDPAIRALEKIMDMKLGSDQSSLSEKRKLWLIQIKNNKSEL